MGTASRPESAAMAGMASMGRKKRRRRRKPRRKEDTVTADSSLEELEAGTESELSLREKPRLEPPGCVRTRQGPREWGQQPGVQTLVPLLMLCDPGKVLDLSELWLFTSPSP